MNAQSSRRQIQRPITQREQHVVDTAITGALDRLGITDTVKWKAERQEWVGILEWFRTMKSKDKARAEAWGKARDLIGQSMVEEGVKWFFRVLAIAAAGLIAYSIGHHFIGGSLLSALLGAE